jgi:hypothetical protein
LSRSKFVFMQAGVVQVLDGGNSIRASEDS